MSYPRTRGHQRAGAIRTHAERRHYGLEAPAIIAIVGTVATVAATAVGTYASYQQGQQQQKAAKYSARVAENQAIAARQAAGLRADVLRERHRRIAATNVASAGSSGVEVAAGSPLLVMADEAMNAELEAQRVQYGGAVDEMGYQSQAALYRSAGRNAATAGTIGAGTTLLSGAATALRPYGRKTAGYES